MLARIRIGMKRDFSVADCKIVSHSVLILVPAGGGSPVSNFLLLLLCRVKCCPEQDRGLEALSGALSRQKEIGLAIGDEVEYQNGERSLTCLLSPPVVKVALVCT